MADECPLIVIAISGNKKHIKLQTLVPAKEGSQTVVKDFHSSRCLVGNRQLKNHLPRRNNKVAITTKVISTLAISVLIRGYTILLFECAKVVSPPKVGGPGGPVLRRIYLANWYYGLLIMSNLEPAVIKPVGFVCHLDVGYQR